MKERKELAMAVVEAAYNRIRMALRGELSVPSPRRGHNPGHHGDDKEREVEEEEELN